MTSLSVSTYNMCLFPFGMRHSTVYADKERRMTEYISRFPNYDIIALQEVFSSPMSSRWRRRINAITGYDIAWCRPPRFHRFMAMDGGLALLSRYPILTQQFVPFEHNIGVMRLADKGFLHAVIDFGHHGTMHVINIHLDPYQESSRNAQLHQIRLYILSQLISQTPFIVVGDFNFDQGSAEYDRMLNTLSCKSGPILEQPTQNMIHPFCNHTQLIRSDFIVGSNHNNINFTSTRVDTEIESSDHYPVSAQLHVSMAVDTVSVSVAE